MFSPKSYQREGQPRKTENQLLVNHVLCSKRQGNYVVCSELQSGTVGWVVARGTVGFRIRKVLLFFPFSKFLSLVSFFSVRLKVRLRIVLRFRFQTVFTDRAWAVLPVGTILKTQPVLTAPSLLLSIHCASMSAHNSELSAALDTLLVFHGV